MVIPAAGWGLKNRWRDPRLFEGVAAECLNTADLMAYVQTMEFSTSSSTCTREQYLKIIVDGLKGLKQSEGYRLRERRTKRKASPDQSTTSKSQKPRMDTNTGSKGRTISDADLDVEGSDHEDCEDEEVAEDEESSVMSEGVNWSLETPAYKIAVDCPIVAAMQDCQRADDHLPEDLPNLFWNWLWFRRYILGVPMERCHMIELDRGNPAWVKKRELHDELQDLTPADKRRIEFVEHIDWFRQLVFCNDVIAVCRSTSGELGITRLRVTMRKKSRVGVCEQIHNS
jgi:hypothetical protein